MPRIVLVVILLVLPYGASANWLRAETPGFIVYSRGSEANLRARLVELQKFTGLARKLTGIVGQADAPPLEVYFITFRELDRMGMDGAAGFYSAGPGGIYAALVTDLSAGRRDLLTVLFHEYTHHLMFQNSRAAYPAWYVEGFASYLSTAAFTEGYTEYARADPGRSGALGGSWMPAATLFTKPAWQSGDVAAFYAEGWLAVHYLSRDPARVKRLNDYLSAVAGGEKPEPAFRRVFGFDFAEFDRQLRSYMNGRRVTVTRITPPPVFDAPPITVTALPALYDTLLIPARRLASSGWSAPRPSAIEPGDTKADIAAKRIYDRDQAARRVALLATIRQETARFAGDPVADRIRAEAEVKLGDRASGIASLDALLAKVPADADVLYIRGKTALVVASALTGAERAATLKQARVWLTRANAARADDFRILAAHAATFSGDLPSHELPVLLRAADLAPQVAEVQASAALALARRGDTAAAKQRLSPIANNPHGGPQAKAAAAMIAAIDKGETPTALPVDLAE